MGVTVTPMTIITDRNAQQNRSNQASSRTIVDLRESADRAMKLATDFTRYAVSLTALGEEAADELAAMARARAKTEAEVAVAQTRRADHLARYG